MTAVALVVGASGAIGGAVAERLSGDGFDVWKAQRSIGDAQTVQLDAQRSETYANLAAVPPCSAVVWAQGTNNNDSVREFEATKLREIVETNAVLVVESLHTLLDAGRIVDGARLCIISSIWQHVTRHNKLSYTVSKAALDGVVRSAAADLASAGILVNAVLPGVLDTPMTRSMLSAEQISAFEQATGFGRLVSLDDVVNTVAFLCSARNSGITGQSIAVDLGFSHERNL